MKTDYPIITSIGIAVGSACVMLLSMIVFSFVKLENQALQLLCYSSCPMIMATLIFPFFCAKVIQINTKCDNNNFKSAIISITGFVISIVMLLAIKGTSVESKTLIIALIVHYIAVGISEEYLSRVVILKLISEKYGKVASIVISAMIFSFILHNNESFIVNCMVRTPLGLVFGYITNKTNCSYYTMSLHALYDLVVVL